MENPYVREELILRPDTRPTARPWQRENSGKMMNSLTASRFPTAVDKALTRPYLCGGDQWRKRLFSLRFWSLNPELLISHSLAVARTLRWHPARHGELMQAIWQMDLGLYTRMIRKTTAWFSEKLMRNTRYRENRNSA